MISLEDAIKAYDILFKDESHYKMTIYRDDNAWYAQDHYDGQNFGGGSSPTEAMLELIAVKTLGRERIKDS